MNIRKKSTLPCSYGKNVPESMLMYGSIFIEVTSMSQHFKIAPTELEITPFPKSLITPPESKELSTPSVGPVPESLDSLSKKVLKNEIMPFRKNRIHINNCLIFLTCIFLRKCRQISLAECSSTTFKDCCVEKQNLQLTRISGS
jgi:hypothetical protein